MPTVIARTDRPATDEDINIIDAYSQKIQRIALPFLGIYYTATVSEGEIKPKDDVAEVRFVNLEEARKLDITYPALWSQIEDLLAS